MPWPISAGVLGIARTTRCAPVARTRVSLRTPAMMDRCSASPRCGAHSAAACANICGLTAHTTSALAASAGPGAASACSPNCAASRARVSAWGSTTCTRAAGSP